MKCKKSTIYANIPRAPGVYIYKNAKGAILYVGKAVNLKRRVSSYFLRPHDARIEKLVHEIKKIECRVTDSALEALILEASLIKKYQPPFNIAQKDDKSFLYVKITKERFPRLLLVRGKDLHSQYLGIRYPDIVFGPFISGSQLREALRIIRRIFPYHVHPPETVGQMKRPCFEYEIGLCPGTCAGVITPREYRKIIRNIRLIFQGKKQSVILALKKEMRAASNALEYERAAKIKSQLFALRHIQDTALISDSGNAITQLRNNLQSAKRIEGYDISNISGTSSVGSMVVCTNGEPDKNQYRKFKIRSVRGANDFAMLREVLDRRLAHREWPLPDLILVDGGAGQVSAVKAALDRHDVRVPVVGLAKGPERKRNDVYGEIPAWTDERTLVKIRDEAHRFAISYHRKLRDRIN